MLYLFAILKKLLWSPYKRGVPAISRLRRRTPYIGPNIYLILVASLNVIVAVEEE